MELVISAKDFKYYTMLKKVIYDLELADKDHWWLISDIVAYPHKKEYEELIDKDNYLLISTQDLVKMLEDDDFQWIWGVFSIIPSKFSKDEILKYDLPKMDDLEEGQYDPWKDEPRLQHPLAKCEIYACDSTYMFMITDDNDLLTLFKKSYPKFVTEFPNLKWYF